MTSIATTSLSSSTTTEDGEIRSNNPPSDSANECAVQYRLYKRRWFILTIVCILNISNAMLWICYAPIANYTDDFYCPGKDCHAADLLSIVFMIIAIPVGIIAMWSVDRYGLRTGILLGSWFNAVGATVRVISTIPQLRHSSAKYPLVLAGQSIAGCAQPFIMFLTTKLAALWFPDGQRTVANTLGSMSNPLGILLAMSISPAIVNTASADQLHLLNLILFAPCAAVAILSTFGVCSSLPPTPPTASAASVSPSFLAGLKMALRSKSFIVLAFCLGSGIGVFNALYTLLQQILCPKGYSNSFVGLGGSLLILGGLLGSVVSGLIVDRTKWFEQVAKVSYSLAAVILCAISALCLYVDMDIAIAIAFALFGAAGFSILPLGLEMGVECTYPVAEATSSGILITIGQLFGIVYVVTMSALAGPASPYDASRELCTGAAALSVTPQNWTVPLLVLCGAASLGAVVFVGAFWPQFKRMEAEQRLKGRTKTILRTQSPELPSEETSASSVSISVPE